MLTPKTRYRLLATTTDDEGVGDLLLVAGAIALGRLAPRSNRRTTGGVVLALATAVRVVDRVHDRTTDGRTDVHLALTTGLADDDVGVLGIADLADGGAAGEQDAAHLGGSGKGETSAYLDFLVWLGLVRAGAGDLANELALAVGRTTKAYRKKYDAVPSSLNKNAKGEQSKPKDALSGNLFGLIGMLSLLDVEYFRFDLRPAVRFGTLEQGDHRLVNVKLFGRNFSVVKDQDKTVLSVDGKHVFEGIGAPFVVRQFAACEEGAEFLLYASGALTLAVRTPVFAAAEPSSLYRFNVEGGRFRIRLQRHRVDVSAI